MTVHPDTCTCTECSLRRALDRTQKALELERTNTTALEQAMGKCCPRNAWGDGEHDKGCPFGTTLEELAKADDKCAGYAKALREMMERAEKAEAERDTQKMRADGHAEAHRALLVDIRIVKDERDREHALRVEAEDALGEARLANDAGTYALTASQTLVEELCGAIASALCCLPNDIELGGMTGREVKRALDGVWKPLHTVLKKAGRKANE